LTGTLFFVRPPERDGFAVDCEAEFRAVIDSLDLREEREARRGSVCKRSMVSGY
jgi:hypothetical protein